MTARILSRMPASPPPLTHLSTPSIPASPTPASPQTIIEKMGVTKTLVREGAGPTPPRGANVKVHCTGWVSDASGTPIKKFWSTKDPGQNVFEFRVGMGSVIRAWDEGVIGMKKGEVARLLATAD
jgi:peptidylprolyl isomerase